MISLLASCCHATRYFGSVMSVSCLHSVTGFVGLQHTLPSSSVSPVSIQLTQRFKRVKMICSLHDWNSICCFTRGVVHFAGRLTLNNVSK